MYGADPRFFDYGTKTGCRRLFAEQGVPHPARPRRTCQSIDEAAEAIAELRAERPGLTQVIIKLNEGVSGEGNAIVDLAGLPRRRGRSRRSSSGSRRCSSSCPRSRSTGTRTRSPERGGVVEERITGEEFRSPSVQMRVTPLGRLEVLSTHDQLLGGPSGQSYLGCIFPADPAYAATITRDAVKVGERLASEGVIGRFAIDFVAVRRVGRDVGARTQSSSTSARAGRPTRSSRCSSSPTGCTTPRRQSSSHRAADPKYFIASDHVENPAYRSLTPDDLFDIGVRRGLHFDQARQTGVVFHMMSALGEYGRTGLTAVGESPDEARALYDTAVATLDEEAAAALAERRLPDA